MDGLHKYTVWKYHPGTRSAVHDSAGACDIANLAASTVPGTSGAVCFTARLAQYQRGGRLPEMSSGPPTRSRVQAGF